MTNKSIYVFVGCNGSGKSTMIKTLLQKPEFNDLPYICPDDMVEHIRDSKDLKRRYIEAMEKCERIRKNMINKGVSFVFETVLSRPNKLSELFQAQRLGYKIIVHAVITQNYQINLKRIKTRVSQGGHDVPKDRVISRYSRSSENINALRKFADCTYIYDNSFDNESPKLIYCEVNSKVLFETPNLWLDKYIIA